MKEIVEITNTTKGKSLMAVRNIERDEIIFYFEKNFVSTPNNVTLRIR